MPTNQSVTLVKGTIPPGLCFSNIPELYNTFVDTTTAYVNGNYSLFNFGNSTPSADDNDKPWIRTDGDGRPDKMYVYKDGYWLCKHPTPASGNERRIWTGTETELLSYEADGNSSSTATIYSGPFWEVDTTLTAPQSSNTSYEADIYDTATIEGIISGAGTDPEIATQDHGLGELPDNVTVSLLCVIDDSSTTGYVVGDEIPVYSSWVNESSSHRDTPTVGVSFNETEVRIILAPHIVGSSDRFDLFHKTDATKGVSPTYANWKFRIRVWKKGGKTISAASTDFSYIKRTARIYYTA